MKRVLCVAVLLAAAMLTGTADAAKPNIIFILSDDIA